jgi:hypothetical protein
MMKENEAAFLAQVALGVFSIRPDGTIWRHAELKGEIKNGRTIKWKFLDSPRRAERSMSGGYYQVMFTHNGKRIIVKAHRIIWIFYNQSEIPEDKEINHKNGIIQDNRPDNLELATHSENMLHAHRVIKSYPSFQGEQNPRSKLTEGQVIEIRKLLDGGTLSRSKIARRFGICESQVGNIYRNEQWTHIVGQ